MGSGGTSVCALASAAGTAAPGTTCNVPYERAPTQATRIRRRMMPTTLATTSRNESKLKAISRWGRRRRIMALPGSGAFHGREHVVVGVQVAPPLRGRQRRQQRVDQVVGADAVRAD